MINCYHFSIILTLLISCTQRETSVPILDHRPDSVAIMLNNMGVHFLGQISSQNADSINVTLYDSTLVYLNRAIETDRLYLMALSNKSRVLRKLGLTEQSLEVVRRIIEVSPNNPEALMEEGFIYEKMGNIEEAELCYKRAMKSYEEIIKYSPDNLVARSNLAFLFVFLYDKDKAIEEAHDLSLRYPESVEIASMQMILKDFERKNFIEEF